MCSVCNFYFFYFLSKPTFTEHTNIYIYISVHSQSVSQLKSNKGYMDTHTVVHRLTHTLPVFTVHWLVRGWGLSSIIKSASAALLALQVIHFISSLTKTLLSSSSALRSVRGWGAGGGGVVVA